MNNSYYLLEYINKEKIGLDTFTFRFSRPKKFKFIPGQYTRIKLLNQNLPSYFFTLSSSPLDNTLTITTKIKHSSPFKQALLSLKTGNKVNFENAQGEFILDQKISTQVFLSGGIGITPFYSMLTYAYQTKLTNKLLLFASFSKESEIIFYNKLTQIAKERNNIEVIYTVSRGLNTNKWKGEVGRVSKQLLKKHIKNLKVQKYMLVGPSSMVIELEKVVAKMGVNDENIQIETFLGY